MVHKTSPATKENVGSALQRLGAKSDREVKKSGRIVRIN
jgi:hypothetical protein